MSDKESQAMKEIHEIRINLYEEDKNLSIEERIRKTNDIALKFLKSLKMEDKFIAHTRVHV